MSKVCLIPLLLCAISCAHNTRDNSGNSLEASTKDLESIVNLAKTSYVRGCIEGMNELIPMKTNGKRLELCTKKSEKHRDDIRVILSPPQDKIKKAVQAEHGQVNGFLIKQK